MLVASLFAGNDRLRQVAERLPFLLLFALVPVYIVFLLQPAFGYFHDDGIYLVNALSLASGSGFRTISLPSELFQTKYPILYPALLAAIWKFVPAFPANVLAFKSISLLATAAWSVASYRLVYRETGSVAAARWILLFTLASPWVLFLSASVLPDTLFALLSTLCLLLFARSKTVSCGALASAAFLLRAVGVAMIIAILVLYLSKKQWKRALLFALVCAALTGPWLLWQAHAPATTDPVAAYYTKLSYRGGSIFGNASFQESLVVLGLNSITELATLSPVAGTLLGGWGTLLDLLAGSVCMAGLYSYFRTKGLTLPLLWFVLYSAMLLCWIAPGVRYELPLLPLALLFVSVGARERRIQWRAAVLTAVCVLALLKIAGEYQLGRLTIKSGSPTFSAVAPDDWSKTRDALEWLRQHAPPDAIIASNNDPVIFLWSRQKAVRPFKADPYQLFFSQLPDKQPLGNQETLRRHLKTNGVSYMLMTPMKLFPEEGSFRKQLAALMRSSPSAFGPKQSFGDPDYYILPVDPGKL